MALNGKNITVLGAGIGGLAAAVALARRGARVTVLEQSKSLGEVGAGLQITPNGAAVLAELGLGRNLLRIGTALSAVELRDYRKDDLVARLDMSRPQHNNPHPYVLAHRADLIEMLAASARRHGVSILLNKAVSGVALGFDQVALPMENGPQRSCRILVGADGIKSKTRDALNLPQQPSFTGQVAWRALIPSLYLPIYDPAPVATITMGPGRHVVTYPVRNGEMINVVAVEQRDTWEVESWNHRDNPENLQNAFASFSPEIRRLLSVCDEVYLWGLFSHPVAQSWSQGTAAILGDACHPMLPFMAQGANMALEDAWVIAEELDRHDEPQSAFEAYQKRRGKRVERARSVSRGNARAYHLANPVTRRLAHQSLRLASKLAPDRATRRFNWLYGHDVTAP